MKKFAMILMVAALVIGGVNTSLAANPAGEYTIYVTYSDGSETPTTAIHNGNGIIHFHVTNSINEVTGAYVTLTPTPLMNGRDREVKTQNFLRAMQTTTGNGT